MIFVTRMNGPTNSQKMALPIVPSALVACALGMNMLRTQQPAITLFSLGMIGLGLLSVIYRDFAYSWQPVPDFHPGRDILAILVGLFMIALGAGLLFRATSRLA